MSAPLPQCDAEVHEASCGPWGHCYAQCTRRGRHEVIGTASGRTYHFCGTHRNQALRPHNWVRARTGARGEHWPFFWITEEVRVAPETESRTV